MSYGLMVYAVNIDQVQSACGGGDMALYEQIIDQFRTEIAALNQSFDLQSYHQTDPSIFEGIRHLIMGQAKTFEGYIYGYGLEYIVRHFGQPLNNALFYPCSFECLSTTIGDRLAGVSIGNLMTGGLIPGVSSFGDFPIYGHLKAAEVANAAAQLKHVLADYADREMDELAFIAAWMQYAADRQEGLVGYYY
jgi:hypothetical protein